MRDIPIIPVCHAGLLPRDLRMPLSLKQGVALNDGDGLQRFYGRVATVLGCNTPIKDFPQLASELTQGQVVRGPSQAAILEINSDRAIQERITTSLNHPIYDWRTLTQVAIEAGISEEQVADLLRADPRVRFNINKKKERVGLRSRVGN
jgi:hypothetical protein